MGTCPLPSMPTLTPAGALCSPLGGSSRLPLTLAARGRLGLCCPLPLHLLLPHPPRDQLNALRREKQKLVEKIMDQYRVLEPGPLPRTK